MNINLWLFGNVIVNPNAYIFAVQSPAAWF